jgi:hypothetical protein
LRPRVSAAVGLKRAGLGGAQGRSAAQAGRLASATQRQRSGDDAARRRRKEQRDAQRRQARSFRARAQERPRRSGRRSAERSRKSGVQPRAVRAGSPPKRAFPPLVNRGLDRRPDPRGEPTVSRSGGPCGPPERDEGARTADALPFAGARAAPDPRAARGALARNGCARLRGRPVSRAQRGPRRSLQDGHDSQAGSAADGLRDVPARILSERRLYGTFLCRGPSPAGLHSSGLSASEGASRARDSSQARRRAGARRAAESARIRLGRVADDRSVVIGFTSRTVNHAFSTWEQSIVRCKSTIPPSIRRT